MEKSFWVWLGRPLMDLKIYPETSFPTSTAANLLIMERMKKLLVDADAFVAINNREDSNYKKAVFLSEKVARESIDLAISDPAFGEAVTVISQQLGIKKAVDFAETILDSSIEIIEVDSILRENALGIFKKQTSKNARFTDAVNMAIMEGEGIDFIFSFDRDYLKNKFKLFW